MLPLFAGFLQVPLPLRLCTEDGTHRFVRRFHFVRRGRESADAEESDADLPRRTIVIVNSDGTPPAPLAPPRSRS